ncbi:MAG TPA: AMP-binding protein [Cycloclasticus sp.]|jgi:fatty-acyl-CoA synthase|nr:AMP-binding protein [Cycloclasticus sp.]HIL92842.1 AMP-binding protein [Cycloclasticus sp.]
MLSYDYGVSDVPLVGKTIGNVFDETVQRYPDKMALISRHQNIRWTYQQYKEQVDAFAAGLIELGLKPGERIGIWSQNKAEWAAVQFATAKAGLILVNINPAYRSSELEYALNKSGCVALVTSPEFKSSNYIDILLKIAPEITTCAAGKLVSERLPALHTLIKLGDEKTPGMHNYADVMSMGTDSAVSIMQTLAGQLQFDDAINIQFTSGTTGSPKGATLSHHGIVNNARLTANTMGITDKDIVCIPVPMYHCFGMVIGTLMCAVTGATAVMPGEAFEPSSVLKTVSDERCTTLYGVPTMFIAMLGVEGFANYDLNSLRTGVMAGSPCPAEVMKQVINEMHLYQMTVAYGMTELSPVSNQSLMDDSFDLRVSTVGLTHPHVEGKIVDENNRIVERGEIGEYCARGYSVMIGYWGDEEKTAESIDAGGWMHTGDLATMDENGYVTVVGRSKDMVIRGGENIYPKEIEDFLYQHDKIEDVQVIGVPDERMGEEICAWVKLTPNGQLTEDELKAYCKEEIAHYKVPRYIKFVDEFPMTVTGKIQKFVMRDTMKKELNL